MGAQHQQGERGFTVIETVLAIAITGLLAATLLGGWSTMINTQRYKDSNKTLQAFLQTQYNLVYNVENGRSNDLTCKDSSSGAVVQDDSTSSATRGQSPCVIMGRYIDIKDGTHIKVYPIVGIDTSDDTAANDYLSIKSYQPQRIDTAVGLSDSELEIPWQATIVGKGNDTTPRSYAIVLLRTPLTGTVHTFTKQTNGELLPIDPLVAKSNEDTDVNLCLDAGEPLAGGRLGITIQAYASSQTFIKSLSDTEGAC